jgi:peptidoglycan/xylan/chitin deacetylase (PgdA/CDA1 family)
MRAILTYHAIDDLASPISLPPVDFARHVAWFASGAVRVVGIEELLTLPDEADAVAITFDDALTSVASDAAPRLAEHGLPATLFVVSDHVGGDNQWGGPRPGRAHRPVLDWTAIAALQAGGWTIGSHTRRHPHLPACNDALLEDELAASAELLGTRLGQRPALLAYPYGDCDARVITATAAHYRVAVGTEHRLLRADESPHHLPRLDAWYFRGANPFAEWGTAAFRRRVAVRHALRRLRRMGR